MLFVKNNNTPYDDALVVESKGLELLKNHSQLIKVPKVHFVNSTKLEMTQVMSVAFDEDAWKKLAIGLALIHSQNVEDKFGLEYDNYIGLNPQKNKLFSSWGEFFLSYRLKYQISLIKDKCIYESFLTILEDKQKSLIHFLDEQCHGVSLVHGDLWSGNILSDGQDVWLIDPAVYYGDKEVDLAMTSMFGGFSAVFYEEYQKILPFSVYYELKKEIYNLYHYLNHYNLFGPSYLARCKQIFDLIKTNF